MKKFKNVLAVMAAAMLTVCLAVCFAACNKAASDDYTVYVKMPDGTACQGVMVQLCELDENGVEGICHVAGVTDADGKVVYKVESGAKCNVHLPSGLPDGYEFVEHVSMNKGDTVTLVPTVKAS